MRNGLTHFARTACGTLCVPQLRASRSDARLRCSQFLVPTMAMSLVDRRCACVLHAHVFLRLMMLSLSSVIFWQPTFACVLALARTLETLRVGLVRPCRNVSIRMFFVIGRGPYCIKRSACRVETRFERTRKIVV